MTVQDRGHRVVQICTVFYSAVRHVTLIFCQISTQKYYTYAYVCITAETDQRQISFAGLAVRTNGQCCYGLGIGRIGISVSSHNAITCTFSYSLIRLIQVKSMADRT